MDGGGDAGEEGKVARGRLTICEGDKLPGLSRGNMSVKGSEQGLQDDVWICGSNRLGSLLTLKTT